MKRYFMLYFLLAVACSIIIGNWISLAAFGASLGLQPSSISTLSPRAGSVTFVSNNPNLYVRGISLSVQGSSLQSVSVTIYNAGNTIRPSVTVQLYDDLGNALLGSPASNTSCPPIQKNRVGTCSVQIPATSLANIRSITVSVS